MARDFLLGHKEGKYWLTLYGLAVALVVVCLFFPILHLLRNANTRVTICPENLKQMGSAALMYEGDWDSKLPSDLRFDDLLLPYLKDGSRAERCHPFDEYYYALNAKLVGVSVQNIAQPQSEILFFDSDSISKNPVGGDPLVPHVGRHDRKSFVVFIDNTVKAFASDEPIWRTLPYTLTRPQ